MVARRRRVGVGSCGRAGGGAGGRGWKAGRARAAGLASAAALAGALTAAPSWHSVNPAQAGLLTGGRHAGVAWRVGPSHQGRRSAVARLRGGGGGSSRSQLHGASHSGTSQAALARALPSAYLGRVSAIGRRRTVAGLGLQGVGRGRGVVSRGATGGSSRCGGRAGLRSCCSMPKTRDPPGSPAAAERHSPVPGGSPADASTQQRSAISGTAAGAGAAAADGRRAPPPPATSFQAPPSHAHAWGRRVAPRGRVAILQGSRWGSG